MFPKLPKVGALLDRIFRNTINNNFIDVIDDINNVQTQLDTIVIKGDSSVEAAQARVNPQGKVYTTLKERIDELDNAIQLEREFDISKIEPQFITQLNGIRNAVNQSICVDLETRCIYSSQSDSNSPEGFYINKLSPAGEYISSMLIVQGGHGTQFGLERLTDPDGEIRLWFYHSGVSKFVNVPYEDFGTITMTEAGALSDYTPATLAGEYFTPTYDPYFDRIALRRQINGRVEIRSRQDIVNHIDNVLYYADIDPLEYSVDRPMQGSITYDKYIYWQSGTSSNIMKIQKYDGQTHEILEDVDFDNIPAQAGLMDFRDTFHEPEGLGYFVHPKTGKHTLLFAVTTGGVTKRYTLMYALSQSGSADYWDATVRLSSPTFSFTKGERALSVEDEITSISQMIKPGWFYIDNTTALTFTDWPYPVGDAGWYVEISPMNQTFTVRQKLIRSSSTNKMFILERVATFNRANFTYSFGDWSIYKTGNRHAENIEPVDWGFKLSKITFPGEYYLSTGDMAAFTDAPYNDAGARLIVTDSADSDDRIKQILVRNSDSIIEKYIRNVNSDGTANPWFFKRLTGSQTYTNITLTAGVTSWDGTSIFRVANDGSYLIFRGTLQIPSTMSTQTTFASSLPNGWKPTMRWTTEQQGVIIDFYSDGTLKATNPTGVQQQLRLSQIVPLY
jgi:hypothetical protein